MAPSKVNPTTGKRQMTRFAAIQEFFSSGDMGRKVEMVEVKALSESERDWFGTQCAKALDIELVSAL